MVAMMRGRKKLSIDHWKIMICHSNKLDEPVSIFSKVYE